MALCRRIAVVIGPTPRTRVAPNYFILWPPLFYCYRAFALSSYLFVFIPCYLRMGFRALFHASLISYLPFTLHAGAAGTENLTASDMTGGATFIAAIYHIGMRVTVTKVVPDLSLSPQYPVLLLHFLHFSRKGKACFCRPASAKPVSDCMIILYYSNIG